MKDGIPVVAIVGRPNVGKSTLFNRLVRRRDSITYKTPGITRDFNLRLVVQDSSSPFYLIDTGGISVEEYDSFSDLVVKQAKKVLDIADIIIFLIDINGVTQDDIVIADFLRKLKKNVILAVNKVDNEKRKIEVQLNGEIYSLGFNPPIMVSAEHDIGVEELLEKLNELLPKHSQPLDEFIELYNNRVKIAIIGRPNVGKSSILNKLLNTNRALVSPIPGTTRDTVRDFFISDGIMWEVVDTAGLRKKSRYKEDVEYFSVKRALRTIGEAEISVLVVSAIDNLTHQDKQIATVALRRYKPVVIALNKWDLKDELRGTPFYDAKVYRAHIKSSLGEYDFAPVIMTSAVTGEGIDKLKRILYTIHNQYMKRIKTSELNRFISEIWDKLPISSKRGELKMKYVTQAEIAPPTFVFFVNNPNLMTNSVKRFLAKHIRDRFNFSYIPIKIVAKEK